MAELATLVGVLKAAGEGTRLRLLALLADGDHSVKDLTEILKQSQPRVSRHLKLLADAGLVQRNAEGAWAYYGLAQDGDGAALGGRHVETLIDLGTGTGRMLDVLAGSYKRGIGIDSSREMLAVARSRLATSGITHAQVRLGDIGDVDLAAGPADVIVIHQVLHYFDDPGRMLAQARRLLKPGGEMIIVDFAPHDLEFLRSEHAHRRLGLSQSQMSGWAAAAGLDVEAVREFPGENSERGLTVCLWRLSYKIRTD